MSCDVGKAMQVLENEAEPHSQTFPPLHLLHSSYSNPSVTSPTSQLILKPFRRFTYVKGSNPPVASPTSQLILQPFRRFTSQLILQPFHRFTYATAHSNLSVALPTSQALTLPLLHLRHSSSFNRSVALPTSQLILQPFRRFTYATAHSPTLPSLYLRHRL